MDARSIIAKVRDNAIPSRDELVWFANGLASGGVTDAQAGAFAMAVVLNGLGDAGRALAQALVDTGNGAGCKTCAMITDMSQPLAPVAGNALEVAEVLRCLRGEGQAERMVDVTCALGGSLLAAIGVVKTEDEGRAKIAEALSGGQAAERFARMVASMGGRADVIEHGLSRLPEAPVVVEVSAQKPGRVTAIDTEALGQIVVHLGGGRLREDDKLDLAVGLTDLQGIGVKLDAKSPLARIHAATEDAAEAAAQVLRRAYTIGNEASVPELVLERIG